MRAVYPVVLFFALSFTLRAADLESLKAELRQAETDFCEQVKRDGLPAGFAANIAADGVMLGLGYADRGAAAVQKVYPENKSNVSLTWKPEIIDVAASGEIGYTTGPWELRITPADGATPTVLTGRYMTVWKRQADGKWKFVLDGGVQDKPGKNR